MALVRAVGQLYNQPLKQLEVRPKLENRVLQKQVLYLNYLIYN